ncbi:MAG: glycosyltransferase [bacterium]
MKDTSKKAVALLWHRFGPYHHARLRAARRLFEVVGVQFSPVDPVYAWDAVKPGAGMLTLFEDRFSQEVPPDEVRARVAAAFGALRPMALAVPGWSDRAPLAALEWAKDHAVPALLMSPSQRDDAPRTRLREWVKGRLVRLFDAALVGGAPQARYLEDLGFPTERISAGYNAVDNAYFARGAARARSQAALLRRRMRLPRDYFVVSARLVPKKNLENLFRAYRVYQMGMERLGVRAWKLLVLGDGVLRPRLESLARERGLAGNVFLPGFKQYGELPAYYGLARALVLPSLSEQWGLAVNEAMASGLPVFVSHRCGCAEDLVQEGVNGRLLEPRDPAQMASVLRWATLAGAGAGKELSAMGQAGHKIIAGHGPAGFGLGLKRSLELALNCPRRRLGALDRLLLRRVMLRTFKESQDA